MELVELKDQLTNTYKDNEAHISEGIGNAINDLREKALKDFSALGIPGKKDENYKYTDLNRYFRGNYSYEIAPDSFKVDLDELFKCDIPELDTHVVLVLNGFYYKKELKGALPEGVVVCGLSEASVKHKGIIENYYAKNANTAKDSLAALNTLFAQDGVFIYVPKGVVVDKPIQIINISYSFSNLRITRRNLVVLEENAEASVLVCDHTLCNQKFNTNSLTEITLKQNANLDYLKLQNENGHSSQVSNTYVHQEANSNCNVNTVSLHGGLIRNNVYATLDGENASNNTYGIFFSDDDQHVGSFTEIHHKKPNCYSDQLFKGILDKKSTAAFNGKIWVDKYASKTLAYQRNNNILLSKEAKMNTKPQLEIYNDDVKCSHGATIGQLDTDALFYIQSRGIGKDEAKLLLMYAFANEVIDKIKLEPIKERIINLVNKRIRGELTACENCNVRCK